MYALYLGVYKEVYNMELLFSFYYVKRFFTRSSNGIAPVLFYE